MRIINKNFVVSMFLCCSIGNILAEHFHLRRISDDGYTMNISDENDYIQVTEDNRVIFTKNKQYAAYFTIVDEFHFSYPDGAFYSMTFRLVYEKPGWVAWFLYAKQDRMFLAYDFVNKQLKVITEAGAEAESFPGWKREDVSWMGDDNNGRLSVCFYSVNSPEHFYAEY